MRSETVELAVDNQESKASKYASTAAAIAVAVFSAVASSHSCWLAHHVIINLELYACNKLSVPSGLSGARGDCWGRAACSYTV